MIFHVFANRSNIGDWLSAKGIQKLLEGQKIQECLCDEPFIEETINILSGAGEEDLIVIGGGGLLMDYFTPFWEAFQPISMKVPFCIWGIGYCDLKDEHSHPPIPLMEDIISRSKLCIVRDELSRDYLSKCKLHEPVPCPSINVIEKSDTCAQDLLHVVNYTTAGADTYEAMCDIAKTFSEKKNVTYRETNNRINPGSEKEMSEILSRYQESGIVLSSALHGCIIGVGMGLKVLAVSGDRKIDAFMKAVGLGDWVLDTSETNKITEKLSALSTQPYPEKKLDEIKSANNEVAKTILTIYQNIQSTNNA